MTTLWAIGWIACATPEPAPTPEADPPAPAPAAAAGPEGAEAKAKARSRPVQVFWLDQAKFDRGDLPALVAVERNVPTRGAEAHALKALFAGPSPEEAEAGLVLVTSGATGAGDLSIQDGIATVKLKGAATPAAPPTPSSITSWPPWVSSPMSST